MLGSSFSSPVGTIVGASLFGPFYIASNVAGAMSSNFCKSGQQMRVPSVPMRVNISLH